MPCIAFGCQELSKVCRRSDEEFCGNNYGFRPVPRWYVHLDGWNAACGLILEKFFGTALLLAPAKERGLGDMVALADKGNAYTGAVKFDSVVSGDKFMWQKVVNEI